MRIGINVPNIAAQNRSGVDLYVQQLAQYVPRADPRNTYYLFVDKRATSQQLGLLKQPNVKVIRLPFMDERKYLKVLGFFARLHKLNLIHFPVGAVPKNLKIPYLVSVLDLTFENYPEFYTSDDLVKQKNTRLIAKNASGVISISRATRDDLIKYYKLSPSKVVVTYLAPKESEVKSRIKPSVTNKPFLLFVGNIQPRKNLIRAVEALSLIKRDLRPKLYIVGKSQDKKEYNKLQRTIKSKKIEKDVVVCGYLSESELSGLYEGCLAIYYPSLYEGFGYNVLEAFLYKKPIILSNTSSLPEIAGKAGIYVDPLSVTDIARGIREVIKSGPSIKKKITLGTYRLKKFTPQKMAKETVGAYIRFSKTHGGK